MHHHRWITENNCSVHSSQKYKTLGCIKRIQNSIEKIVVISSSLLKNSYSKNEGTVLKKATRVIKGTGKTEELKAEFLLCKVERIKRSNKTMTGMETIRLAFLLSQCKGMPDF